MKNFDLQVSNRTFEIEFVFINHDGGVYKVYEHIYKKHWWSNNRKYLFEDVCLVGEDVEATISFAINEYLSNEAVYNDFLEQISKLEPHK